MTRLFQDFTATRAIAEGGTATLFEGYVHDVDAPVALKVLRPDLASDPDVVRTFQDEARLAARIIHPNVVRTFGGGKKDGQPFIVMELIQGASLLELCSRFPTAIDPEHVLTLFLDLLAGLSAVHELEDEAGRPLNIVHRDVTPHNAIVDRTGLCKLVDFGGARTRKDLSKATPAVALGKFAYLSPEQLAGGPVDRRTDIYSAGVTLWELLTGRRPFEAPRLELLREKILRAERRPLEEIAPGLPTALRQAVEQAQSRKPEKRFATAAEFALALDPDGERLKHTAQRRKRLATEAAHVGAFDAPAQRPAQSGQIRQTRDELRALLRELWKLEESNQPDSSR